MTAVRLGIRQVRAARRLVFIYYCVTLLFGLAAALPLAFLAIGDLGTSLWAGRMQRQFDLDWIFEFLHRSGRPVSAIIPPAALVLGGIFLTFGTFLSGGVVSHFARGHAYAPAAFWGDCGRSFARLLRLLIYSGLFYALVLALNISLASLAGRIFAESMEERPVALFAWGRTALVLMLLLCVNMVMDYARVRLVVEDSRKSFRAVLASFRFVARNFKPVAGAFGAVLLLLGAAAALGHFAARALPWILAILAQQLFVLARVALKLLFYASETQVYLALRPVATQALPQEPAPAGLDVSCRHSPEPPTAAGREGAPAEPAEPAGVPAPPSDPPDRPL